MPPPSDLGSGRVFLLGAAAGALGLALQINDGCYDPSALALLSLTLGAILWAVIGLPRAPARLRLRLQPRSVDALLAGLLALQFAVLLTQPIAVPPLVLGPTGIWLLRVLLAAGALAAGGIFLGGSLVQRRLFPALLLLHLLVGLWVLRHAPGGDDVLLFQKASVAALLDGNNPYAIRFPNVFHPNEGFYGAGVVQHRMVQFGYPYPPLPLLLTLPAAFLGDIRTAHLAALTVAGAAIGYARPSRTAFLAAALLLFSPRFGHLVRIAWIEPFVILLLSGTVFCLLRAPRLVVPAVGMLLVVKQYQILMIPLLWLAVAGNRQATGRTFARLLAKASVAALIVTLPLALWSLGDFIQSVVVLQFKQPFRHDALSFMAAWARAGGTPSGLPALILAPLGAWIALRRLPRTPAGFAAAVALTFAVFFAFNKQAFCNYYFLVIGALATAVAAADPSRGDVEPA